MRNGTSNHHRDEAARHERDVVELRDTPVPDDNQFLALGVSRPIVEVLWQRHIDAPFPIQEATLPDAIGGRDILGRGQTGSGKTLAFGLPTLTRIAAGKPAQAHRPSALIMVPTRELAMQVCDALKPLAKAVGRSICLVAGGLSYTPQIKALEGGVDLLVATPGRLQDLMERRAVELEDVQVLVLDEADHMAEMGFMEDIEAVMATIPDTAQKLLFSATLDHGVQGVVERKP
ncbi:enoyl-CoA hydratase [Platysternon megacephalum]|uniref:Enoyl-CoA hydratase n=1 Tax=Platysternon megacephalum TaxID=55544 RepID=A0A4D9DCQ3_9SAUR|nr:enoyl-CoA hydratase [Platysternon megacephalum]